MAAEAESVPTTAQGAVRRFLTVQGHRVSYLEWGDQSQPTVILLHGVIGSALSLEWLGVALGPSHHVIALDAICRGHSDWVDLPWPALSAPDVAGTRISHGIAAVRELIKARQLDGVVLVGLSTGGVVAGWCAAHDAEGIRGAFIDDGPFARTDADLGTTRHERERAVDGEEWASLDAALDGSPSMFGLSALGTTRNDPRWLDLEWRRQRGEELFFQTGERTWLNRPSRPSGWQAASLRDSVRLLAPDDVRAIRIPTVYLHNDTQSHWNEQTVEELASLNPAWVSVWTIPGPKDNPSVFVSSAAPHLFLMTLNAFLASMDGAASTR